MRTRCWTLFCLLPLLLSPSPGVARNKAKITLPAYVLQARTVAVLIDPQAGMDINDPRANQVARQAVESALLNWGRLQPVVSSQTADLLIVVRRGNGRIVNETVADPSQNRRPAMIGTGDSSASMGAQRGIQNYPPDASQTSSSTRAQPQIEGGQADDTFTVYQGNVESPLDSNPAWRLSQKNALQGPSVAAVTAFRKAIEDGEKAASKKP